MGLVFVAFGSAVLSHKQTSLSIKMAFVQLVAARKEENSVCMFHLGMKVQGAVFFPAKVSAPFQVFVFARSLRVTVCTICQIVAIIYIV